MLFFSFFFFSIMILFHGHWQLTGQQGKWWDHLLFHSTISTRSWTLRQLFATLDMGWLSHIFNCNACIYQTTTWWDLPPYWIKIWLTDDVILIFLYLLVELIYILLQLFDMRNRWNQTLIDYHHCITNEPSNQVC